MDTVICGRRGGGTGGNDPPEGPKTFPPLGGLPYVVLFPPWPPKATKNLNIYLKNAKF